MDDNRDPSNHLRPNIVEASFLYPIKSKPSILADNAAKGLKPERFRAAVVERPQLCQKPIRTTDFVVMVGEFPKAPSKIFESEKSKVEETLRWSSRRSRKGNAPNFLSRIQVRARSWHALTDKRNNIEDGIEGQLRCERIGQSESEGGNGSRGQRGLPHEGIESFVLLLRHGKDRALAQGGQGTKGIDDKFHSLPQKK
jgi:hypothetical protein